MTSELDAGAPGGELTEVSAGAIPSTDAEFSAPSASAEPVRPWGIWATVGWTLFIALVSVGVQIVVIHVVVQLAIARDALAQVM
jgi:hypothetical protein